MTGHAADEGLDTDAKPSPLPAARFPSDPAGDSSQGTPWFRLADDAYAAVLSRSVRPLAGLPGTALGVVGEPPTAVERLFVRRNFWWQAHLLDLLLDARLRRPSAGTTRLIRRLDRGLRWSTPGMCNGYYDDLAWYALSVQRAGPLLPGGGRQVRRIGGRLLAARTGGGVRWRRGDDFVNVPATAPTALLLARAGAFPTARVLLDWINENLGTATGLVADGMRRGAVVPDVWTYNQGTVLGAELELARAGGPSDRLHRMVAAVDARLAPGGVLITHGGGDGGLFTGILARYLALTATTLPGADSATSGTRQTCRRLVLTTAGAVAATTDRDRQGRAVFSADWTRPAVAPPWTRRPGSRVRASEPPESDLSVQLSAWMVLEAAATLTSPDDGGAVEHHHLARRPHDRTEHHR